MFQKNKTMKKVIALMVVFLSTAYFTPVQAQEIEWVNLEDAQKLNEKKETAKWIIVDMNTSWCGPCRMMERNTFTDNGVIELMNEHFHAVNFNAEGPDDVTFNGKVYSNPSYDVNRGSGRNSMHELTKYFKISGYPTLVVIDEKGAVVQLIVGYQSPQNMISVLTGLLEKQSKE